MDNTEPKSPPALEAQFPTARPPPSHISDVKTPIPGWPSLANLIAQNPELEAFPSFSDLAIKSLLYYQAELIHLRKELHRSECVDLYKGDSNATYFAQNLSYLITARDAAIENSTELPQQWILMEKIRITLEKYNSALLQLSNVSDFMEAETSKVQSLKDCVKHIAVDGQSLDGDGALTWGDTGKATCSVDKSLWTQFFGLFTALVISRDIKRRPIKNVFQETLVFPRQGARLADRLTQWVLHSFVPFYGHLRRGFSFSFYLSYIRRLWHWFRGVKELSTYNIESSRTREIFTTSYYSGYVILRFTFIIITVVTCLLPTVAIAVLAKVNSKDLVLKLITVFTAIFALGFIFFLFFQLKESDLSC